MSATTIAKPCTEVTVLGMMGGPQTVTLPEGATLADLLRHVGAEARSLNFLIDGRYIEEALVLKSGMRITIFPESLLASPGKDWRKTVGIFADDPTFDEFVAACRAIREEDRRLTLEEMDAEQERSINESS
jgi:sulfur carrier protein ThiS